MAVNVDKLDHDRLRGYSAIMGAPLSGLDVPSTVIALQGLYLPGASASRQPQSQQVASTGPTGRPPKTGRTEVAGSNVSSLIS